MCTTLYTLIMTFIVVILFNFFLRDTDDGGILTQYVSNFLSLFVFGFYCWDWFLFNTNSIAPEGSAFEFLGWSLSFASDGLSLLFNLLAAFLFIIISPSEASSSSSESTIFVNSLFLLQTLISIVFSTLDLFLFYIAYELILIPMLIIIFGWGSRSRKIKASFYFFLYTLFGSFFMLLGLIRIYFAVGTTNLIFLVNCTWDSETEKLLWFLFFLPLAIKIPMFPFYIWLPEAHVEAPTIGSVILAGLLLKLGSFGFLRILLPLFPQACYFYTPLVFILSAMGVFSSSVILLCQIDLKRIIAYSSIAHMNYALLGLFSNSIEGYTGSVFLMISHGFTSSALFFLVGFLYDRFHSRLLFYYSGLSQLMPLFYFFFFFFIITNFGFPGLANFIGEVSIFLNLLNISEFLLFFFFFGLFFSLIYSMLLFNRLFLGDLRVYNISFGHFSDLTITEICVLIPLFLVTLFLGLFPTPILDLISDINPPL